MGEADPQPTVFLSYARADRAQAARLAAALETAGFVVWQDTMIEGGAAFAKSIESALETCDAVVVAWSPGSVSSDWVLDEAARGRDLKKLVPVSLDGTGPPLGFRQYQAVDLSRWSGDAAAPEIAAVVRGTAAVSGRPAPPPRQAAQIQARRRFSRRAAIGIAAGAAGAAGFA